MSGISKRTDLPTSFNLHYLYLLSAESWGESIGYSMIPSFTMVTIAEFHKYIAMSNTFQVKNITKDLLEQHKMPPLSDWYEDKVFMNSKLYKKIFEKERKLDKRNYQTALVKIKAGNKVITRAFNSAPFPYENGKPTIFLPMSAVRELTGSYKDLFDAEVSTGCWLSYYWKHPISATRISTRIGLVGLFFSILSFLITILLRN